MRKMTESNLNSAFAGESMAHMKYTIYSDRAQREGRSNVARLFQAIAYAERVHATNHYRELGHVKDTSDNLQVAIDGETYEVEEMYPAFNNVARLQEEKGAIRSTEWAWESEKGHAELYKKAKEAVQGGQDAAIGDIYICGACGWTVEGEAPDVCPVCKAKRDHFRKF
ncbi:MAG: rubrerythrin family protein [Chloroflexi bacterium]|nr:rubrerythrin family protein [Chloroflexota bacterium]